MAEEPQYHNIHGKPLFDILSKLPSKSLLRFRCVSKLWREYIDDSYFVSVHDKRVIEDPTPIMFNLNKWGLAKSHFFHTIESHNITNHVLKAKNKVPVFDFVGQRLRPEVVGSCNGLVLFESYYDSQNSIPNFIVIHPMNKQCYVLPQLEILDYYVDTDLESYGFGFDSSTNTFKMVFVYVKHVAMYSYGSLPHRTMVHVFGTNSWYEIPKAPDYSITGEAIFAHGCLHWLDDCVSTPYNFRQVIWFDVTNEEFGLIKLPNTISESSLADHLVNLDGQVGYFCDETMEVWVLNHMKGWVLHCNLEGHDLHDYDPIKVLGCVNKAGDILIKISNEHPRKEMFYIYNLKNRVMHEARIDGLDLEDGSRTDIVMFPNSLLDIITNSNLIKKALEENMKPFWQR